MCKEGTLKYSKIMAFMIFLLIFWNVLIHCHPLDLFVSYPQKFLLLLIAISYHMLDSIFFTREFSLWRKFKSHKISLSFLILYMLLECSVCALWILKHKYALHYKAFWLNAQDFPFSIAPSLCDIILRKFQFCLWCMSRKKFHLITSNCNFLYVNCVFFLVLLLPCS